MPKNQFLHDEIWMLSTLGAFQRANIYIGNAPEQERKYFRNMLKGWVGNLVNQYSKPIFDEQYIANIKSLCESSKDFGSILKNGQINFGVSQKLLNLYLKYLWCLGKIEVPPHFPVDRIIQKQFAVPNARPWTQMQSAEEYMTVITHAREKLKTETRYSSLAEMELILFSRN